MTFTRGELCSLANEVQCLNHSIHVSAHLTTLLQPPTRNLLRDFKDVKRKRPAR